MTLQLFDSFSAAARPDAERVLGGFWLGDEAPVAPCPWPLQRLVTPLLGTGLSGLDEAWWVAGDAPLLSGETEGIAWRRSGDLLFGVIEMDEARVAAEPQRSALQTASEQAYARIFRLLDAQGLPHLWRLWNYMGDINGESGGLERYRQFNLGRAEAFEGAARSVVGRVPAACALGVAGGPMTIAFLAGATPVLPIENPRQVSAFLYPSDYGPRPPTFSRAALAWPPRQEILFVSGTASIVGHQTVHPGDVRAQTVESLDNIVAVLTVASGLSRSGAFALRDLGYRVYVRHAADLEAVRAVVAARVPDAAVVYLRADVCRADLLVEIEGQVIRRPLRR
jgi:enamine deaminase RidA (YjgF/YER057c/UK114 family)